MKNTYTKLTLFTTLSAVVIFCASSVIPAKKTLETDKGIPKNIGLFCPINKTATRDDSGKFPENTQKWYEEIAGQTQIFRLFKGDSIVRGFDEKRFHARTEVGGLDIPTRFPESENWYMAEYTILINTGKEHMKETMTISQLFAGCCGPQFRLELRKDGTIGYGSRTNGNKLLLGDKDYANGKNPLKVKMISNGRYLLLYLNDKQIKFEVDGKTLDQIQTEESKKGTANVLYHYRWGLYYNKPMYKDISSTVTSITCKKVDPKDL